MLSPHAERLRREALEAIPWWYSPWVHLAFPSLVGAAVIAASLALVRGFAAWHLLAIPIGLVLANAVEWRTHKEVLHKRTWYAPVLYDQHTPKHHQLYTTETMAIHDPRELRLVLIPAYGILLILLSSAPLVALLWLWQPNLALFWLATNTFYVLSYEWLHLAYHAPAGSFAARNTWIAKLRHHHAVHHDLALMQEWNFNVTVPLWDWLAGTIHREQRDDDTTGERAGPPAQGLRPSEPRTRR